MRKRKNPAQNPFWTYTKRVSAPHRKLLEQRSPHNAFTPDVCRISYSAKDLARYCPTFGVSNHAWAIAPK